MSTTNIDTCNCIFLLLHRTSDESNDDDSVKDERIGHSSRSVHREMANSDAVNSSRGHFWTYVWNVNSDTLPTKFTAQLSVYLITLICECNCIIKITHSPVTVAVYVCVHPALMLTGVELQVNISGNWSALLYSFFSLILGALIVLLDALLVFCEHQLADLNVYVCTLLAVIFAMVIVATIALSRQPKSPKKLSFKVSTHGSGCTIDHLTIRSDVTTLPFCMHVLCHLLLPHSAHGSSCYTGHFAHEDPWLLALVVHQWSI